MNAAQRIVAREEVKAAKLDLDTKQGQREAFLIVHKHEVAATHRTTVPRQVSKRNVRSNGRKRNTPAKKTSTKTAKR